MANSSVRRRIVDKSAYVARTSFVNSFDRELTAIATLYQDVILAGQYNVWHLRQKFVRETDQIDVCSERRGCEQHQGHE